MPNEVSYVIDKISTTLFIWMVHITIMP